MSIAVSRIELSGFELLPPHGRRCVFWEVDPGPPTEFRAANQEFGSGGGPESEFDKEAWISATLLEWGACGQMAIDSGTGKVVGTAFYGPPGRIPRSRYFPTGPVSADAVQLTGIHTEPGHAQSAVALLDAVVADLVRRGVRAVEAFGIVRSHGAGYDVTSAAAPDARSSQWSQESVVDVAREILQSPLRDLCSKCLIDADFLQDNAFQVVAPHSRFPRLRLELDEGLGWKSEVEGALERLFVMAQLDLNSTERSSAPVGRHPGR